MCYKQVVQFNSIKKTLIVPRGQLKGKVNKAPCVKALIAMNVLQRCILYVIQEDYNDH